MRFSPLILLPAVVLAAVYDTPTASVATITNTRTVMRVATVTSTGHSPVGTAASSYVSSLTANATAITTAKVSPTASSTTVPSNGAAQDSISVALIAIAGVASFFLL